MQEIEYASSAFLNGKTILYPTDTIWGIGCDARNKEAIDKIGAIKQREPKGYVILVCDLEMLESIVSKVPQEA